MTDFEIDHVGTAARIDELEHEIVMLNITIEMLNTAWDQTTKELNDSKKESTMENLDTLRQKFQEAVDDYNTGKDTAYYEGKIVGIVETVAAIKGISWIEADNLLSNAQ